jgi:hypothetical protein
MFTKGLSCSKIDRSLESLVFVCNTAHFNAKKGSSPRSKSVCSDREPSSRIAVAQRGGVRKTQLFSDQADLNRLPHSRQAVSKRGVMSPQNGHMRCDAKSPSFGSMLDNLLRDAAMKERRRRTRMRNGCSTGSMLMFQVPYDCTPKSANSVQDCSPCAETLRQHRENPPVCHAGGTKVSTLDQLFSCG